jgi:DNA polymerase III subunit delta'
MVKLLDIVGQDSAVALLQRRMAAGRMGHALMFTGPHGVGRRTTAVALAASLLCESPVTSKNNGEFPELEDDFQLTDACGLCSDCKTLAAGTHPDMAVISKELAAHHPDPSVRNRKMQNLSIGVIKHFLLNGAYLAPSRGRGKVFIVREAELMTHVAQNALLKTLEEPPPGVTIILLCRRAEQMLPTTISRCHTVQFGPLPSEFVTEQLVRAEVPQDQAAFWAAFTDGSVGRSLSLAASEMYPVKCEIIDELARLAPGGDAGLGERLQKITDSQAVAAVKAAKSQDKAELSKSLATRRATGTMLELIAAAFRDAISLSSGSPRALVNSDQTAAIETIASRKPIRQLAGAIEQLSEYEQLLWRNVNPKIVWDNVVLTCA